MPPEMNNNTNTASTVRECATVDSRKRITFKPSLLRVHKYRHHFLFRLHEFVAHHH